MICGNKIGKKSAWQTILSCLPLLCRWEKSLVVNTQYFVIEHCDINLALIFPANANGLSFLFSSFWSFCGKSQTHKRARRIVYWNTVSSLFSFKIYQLLATFMSSLLPLTRWSRWCVSIDCNYDSNWCWNGPNFG